MKKRHRQMAGKGLKDVTNLNKCPACGKTKKMHTLCPHCIGRKSPLPRRVASEHAANVKGIRYPGNARQRLQGFRHSLSIKKRLLYKHKHIQAKSARVGAGAFGRRFRVGHDGEIALYVYLQYILRRIELYKLRSHDRCFCHSIILSFQGSF